MKKAVFQYPILDRTYPVYVRVGVYYDKSLAVLLESADEEEYGEPFCDVTKCVDAELGEYQAVVKNYAENESMIDFLVRNGFGKLEGRSVQSGYVQMPVFCFSKDRLQELDSTGCTQYEQAFTKKHKEFENND